MPRGVPNVKVEASAEPATEAAIEALPEVEPEPVPEVTDRFETFEAARPNGDVVVVTRNIDTGEQSVIDK